MAISDGTSFGRCECSEQIELRWVEVRIALPAGGHESFGDVPQGRCPRCGNVYYKVWTLQAIESTFRAAKR